MSASAGKFFTKCYHDYLSVLGTLRVDLEFHLVSLFVCLKDFL